MEEISAIINSVATILWPLIAIMILILFRKNVQGLIESARGRKFTVKIGKMELSMDEFSKQQSVMINDLQARVNELQRKVDATTTRESISQTEKLTFDDRRVDVRRAEDVQKVASKPNVKSAALDIDDDIKDILWVDDNPKNNAFLIDSLDYHGVSVFNAANTKEAVERFKRGAFDCVISDSCRHEGDGVDNCQAGFELSSIIRELDEEVPIYIYADEVNERLKEKAENVGATAITSSPSELLKLLSD